MTHSILHHLRSKFRLQKVIFNIASTTKCKKVLDSRCEGLFSSFTGQLNTGTDKTPKQSEVFIVYASNIALLVRRSLKSRGVNDLPIAVKLGLDHGQGKLLCTLNLNFSNSVDQLLVVAVSLEAKENRSCLTKILELLKIEEYISTLGDRGKGFIAGDVKFLQLVAGILGGNANFPCYDCGWHAKKDSFELLGPDRNPIRDLEQYRRFNDRARDHGQFAPKSLAGVKLAIPVLQIVSSIFVKVFYMRPKASYIFIHYLQNHRRSKL